MAQAHREFQIEVPHKLLCNPRIYTYLNDWKLESGPPDVVACVARIDDNHMLRVGLEPRRDVSVDSRDLWRLQGRQHDGHRCGVKRRNEFSDIFVGDRNAGFQQITPRVEGQQSGVERAPHSPQEQPTNTK